MDPELKKAKQLLQTSDYTCVLCLGDTVCTSNRRGVAPLLEFLSGGKDFSGFYAADKVVGRATAFLYCLLGIRSLYARVLSVGAARVLAARRVSVFCDKLVPGIRNRTDTGPCPMEAATAAVTTPEEALTVIRETLKALQ